MSARLEKEQSREAVKSKATEDAAYFDRLEELEREELKEDEFR